MLRRRVLALYSSPSSLQNLGSKLLSFRQVFGEAEAVGVNDTSFALHSGGCGATIASRSGVTCSDRSDANASFHVEIRHLGSRSGPCTPSKLIPGAPLHCRPSYPAMGLRLCHSIRSIIDGSIRAAPFSPFRSENLIPWSAAQMVTTLNYSDDTSNPARASPGELGLSQVPSQNVGPGQHAAASNGSAKSKKVVARITGTPKFMFKSDLLWLLKGCKLSPDDVVFIYDAKLRTKFIQVQLDFEDVSRAQRAITINGRFGGRFLKMTLEEFPLDETNEMLAVFRGRSLLMANIPSTVMTEHVERFFSGYSLDQSYSIRFLRWMVPHGGTGSGNQGSAVPVKREFESRVLVRFKTELEALRALREKQGSICLEHPTELRFIE